MSDDLLDSLARIARAHGSTTGATAQAAKERIAADEALMRQALDYILIDGDFLNPDSVEATRQLIAALRERLGEKS